VSGVSREAIEHTVNMKPGSKPVKQGLCHFNQEERKAIGEELARLLDAAFIKEVQHLDWIENPVLLLKKMGSGGCALTI
jgi:hypothetical protein